MVTEVVTAIGSLDSMLTLSGRVVLLSSCSSEGAKEGYFSSSSGGEGSSSCCSSTFRSSRLKESSMVEFSPSEGIDGSVGSVSLSDMVGCDAVEILDR